MKNDLKTNTDKHNPNFCILPLAALLALFGTATAAHAGQILYVNAINTGTGAIATYSFSQNGSGDFSASTMSLVTTGLRNSDWLVQGQTGATVPYLWETDAYGGAQQYTSAGTALLYTQPYPSINQSQSVEDSSGNIYTRNYPNFYIGKTTPGGTGTGSFVSVSGSGLAIDPSGIIYSAQNGNIEKYSGSGADLGVFATYTGGAPSQLQFDSKGDLFGLVNNTTLVEWGSTGSYLGIFASSLPNTLGGGRSQDPNSFAIDGKDNIFLAQGYGSLYEISSTGTVSTFESTSSGFQMYSVAVLSVQTTPEPSTGLLFLGAASFLLWGSRKYGKRVN